MRVNSVDHYEILGIGRDADAEAIRSAWRLLARRHHPDITKGRGTARRGTARRFIRIRKAYEVLADPARRQRYDEWLERIAPSRAPRQRTPASPRRHSTPNARARQGGVRLDLLGIIQVDATLGAADARHEASEPRARRRHT